MRAPSAQVDVGLYAEVGGGREAFGGHAFHLRAAERDVILYAVFAVYRLPAAEVAGVCHAVDTEGADGVRGVEHAAGILSAAVNVPVVVGIDEEVLDRQLRSESDVRLGVREVGSAVGIHLVSEAHDVAALRRAADPAEHDRIAGVLVGVDAHPEIDAGVVVRLAGIVVVEQFVYLPVAVRDGLAQSRIKRHNAVSAEREIVVEHLQIVGSDSAVAVHIRCVRGGAFDRAAEIPDKRQVGFVDLAVEIDVALENA